LEESSVKNIDKNLFHVSTTNSFVVDESVEPLGISPETWLAQKR
jgi:hypothetical protein